MVLFAEATDVVAWASLISSVGFPAALLLWILVYRDPQIASAQVQRQKEQDERVREEREIFLQAELRRSADSKERLQAIADANEKALNRIIGHCEKEALRRDQAQAASMITVEKAIVQNIEVLEEVRNEMAQMTQVVKEVKDIPKPRRGGQ